MSDNTDPSGSLPRLYTEKETAAYLGVSPPTLRRWRDAGRIGHIKVGKKPRYTHEHLTSFLEANTVHPKVRAPGTPSSRRSSTRSAGPTRQSVLAQAHAILNAYDSANKRG